MYVTSQSELAAMCDIAAREGRVGIDLEFIPEHTYYPQLAMVQLAVGDSVVLVDPLGGLDLEPVHRLVLDPEVRVVLHAGIQDMMIIYHRTGDVPRNVFDTQLAAAFAGLGHQISYARAVEELTGHRLTRDASYTDWLRRPLSGEQEAYALDDVRYLFEMEEILCLSLGEAGRLGWVLEETAACYEKVVLYEPDVLGAHERVKKSGAVKGRSRGVLVELSAWREREARRRDLPRRKVMTDEVVVEIARVIPASVDHLAGIHGLGRRERSRYGRAIIETVKAGISRASSESRAEGPVRPSDAEGMGAQLLLMVLRSVCEDAGISPAMVGTRSDVEDLTLHLMKGGEGPLPRLLTGWRSEVAGRTLVSVMEGSTAVTWSPDDGRLRIIS